MSPPTCLPLPGTPGLPSGSSLRKNGSRPQQSRHWRHRQVGDRGCRGAGHAIILTRPLWSSLDLPQPILNPQNFLIFKPALRQNLRQTSWSTWQFLICSMARNGPSGDFLGQRAFRTCFRMVFEGFRGSRSVSSWPWTQLAPSWSPPALETNLNLPYEHCRIEPSFPLSAPLVAAQEGLRKHLSMPCECHDSQPCLGEGITKRI